MTGGRLFDVDARCQARGCRNTATLRRWRWQTERGPRNAWLCERCANQLEREGDLPIDHDPATAEIPF